MTENRKMSKRNLFLILIILVTLQDSRAEENEFKKDSFSESLLEVVKVSGAIKVGVMLDTETKKPTLNEFYLHVPGDVNSEKACVEIRSIDGKYFAGGTVESLQPKTRYKVNFKSKYKNQLLKYNSDELVILTSIENDCLKPSKKAKYIPSSWSLDTTNKLAVYLNSGTQVTSYSSDETNEPLPCQSVSKERRPVSYDTVCLIENINNFENLKIFREDFGTPFTPINFRILK